MPFLDPFATFMRNTSMACKTRCFTAPPCYVVSEDEESSVYRLCYDARLHALIAHSILEPLLITGASGFVGAHAQKILPAVTFADERGEIDICDRTRLRAFIERIRPKVVVHLAALTFVPGSFANERRTYEVNFLGTLNLLDALRDAGFDGRMLYVSSADAYGSVPEERLPISESQPLAPRNPYAASKAAAEALCKSWACNVPFSIVIARPFNHIGPGQHEYFAVSQFAKQITEIKLGRRKPVIETGDLDVTRDFADVRDVVRAYRLLLASGESGDVYNVCSAQEVSIRSVLQRLLALSGVDAKVEQSPARGRGTQQLRAFGSYDKLHAITGWRPEISLDQSLSDVLNDWSNRLNV